MNCYLYSLDKNYHRHEKMHLSRHFLRFFLLADLIHCNHLIRAHESACSTTCAWRIRRNKFNGMIPHNIDSVRKTQYFHRAEIHAHPAALASIIICYDCSRHVSLQVRAVKIPVHISNYKNPCLFYDPGVRQKQDASTMDMDGTSDRQGPREAHSELQGKYRVRSNPPAREVRSDD
jgi:hypothetical protein